MGSYIAILENDNLDKVQKMFLHIGGTTNIFDRERVREKERDLEKIENDRKREIKSDRERGIKGDREK